VRAVIVLLVAILGVLVVIAGLVALGAPFLQPTIVDIFTPAP
jgi:hypothetical protein